MNENFKVLKVHDSLEYEDNTIDELAQIGLPRQAQASILYVREKWLPIPSLTKDLDNSVVSTKTAAIRIVRADIARKATPFETIELVKDVSKSQQMSASALVDVT